MILLVMVVIALGRLASNLHEAVRAMFDPMRVTIRRVSLRRIRPSRACTAGPRARLVAGGPRTGACALRRSAGIPLRPRRGPGRRARSHRRQRARVDAAPGGHLRQRRYPLGRLRRLASRHGPEVPHEHKGACSRPWTTAFARAPCLRGSQSSLICDIGVPSGRSLTLRWIWPETLKCTDTSLGTTFSASKLPPSAGGISKP